REPAAATRKMGRRKKADRGSIASSQGPNGNSQARRYVVVVWAKRRARLAGIPASAARIVVTVATICPGPGIRINRPGMPAKQIKSAAIIATIAGSQPPCRAEYIELNSLA